MSHLTNDSFFRSDLGRLGEHHSRTGGERRRWPPLERASHPQQPAADRLEVPETGRMPMTLRLSLYILYIPTHHLPTSDNTFITTGKRRDNRSDRSSSNLLPRAIVFFPSSVFVSR